MTVIARDAVAADHLVYAWPFPIGPECDVAVQTDEAAVMCPAWLVGDRLGPGRHHWRSPDPTRPVSAYFVLTTPVEVGFELETQFILPSVNQRVRLVASGSVQVKCGDPSLLVAQFVGLPFDNVNDGIVRSVSRSLERMLARLLIRRVVMGGTPAVVTDPAMLPHIIEELVAYNPTAGAVFGVELLRIGHLAIQSDDGSPAARQISTTAEWGRVGRDTPPVGSPSMQIPSIVVEPMPVMPLGSNAPGMAPVSNPSATTAPLGTPIGMTPPPQRGSSPTLPGPDLKSMTPRTSQPLPVAPVTMRHAAVPIPTGPGKTPAMGIPITGNGSGSGPTTGASGAVSSAMAISASGEIVLRPSPHTLVPPPPPSVVERAAQSLEIQIIREEDVVDPPAPPPSSSSAASPSAGSVAGSGSGFGSGSASSGSRSASSGSATSGSATSGSATSGSASSGSASSGSATSGSASSGSTSSASSGSASSASPSSASPSSASPGSASPSSASSGSASPSSASPGSAASSASASSSPSASPSARIDAAKLGSGKVDGVQTLTESKLGSGKKLDSVKSEPAKVDPVKKSDSSKAAAPEPAGAKGTPSPAIIGIGVSHIRSIEDGNSLSGEIPSKVSPGSRVLFPGPNGLMQSATVRQLLQGYYELEVGSSGDTVWVPVNGVVPE